MSIKPLFMIVSNFTKIPAGRLKPLFMIVNHLFKIPAGRLKPLFMIVMHLHIAAGRLWHLRDWFDRAKYRAAEVLPAVQRYHALAAKVDDLESVHRVMFKVVEQQTRILELLADDRQDGKPSLHLVGGDDASA